VIISQLLYDVSISARDQDTPPSSAHRKLTAYPDKLGYLRVTVKTGDITKERVDAIVNSTNEQLDLSTGMTI